MKRGIGIKSHPMQASNFHVSSMHSSFNPSNTQPLAFSPHCAFEHNLPQNNITITMAKHPLSLLILALFLFAAAASASALHFDDDNQRPWLQRCRQQVRGGERLRQCEQLLMRPRRVGQLLAAEEEEDAVEHLEECCQQLRGMDEACRCDGLRQIVQRRRQQGRVQGIDVGQMLERASQLPSVCRLSQRRCELRSSQW